MSFELRFKGEEGEAELADVETLYVVVGRREGTEVPCLSFEFTQLNVCDSFHFCIFLMLKISFQRDVLFRCILFLECYVLEWLGVLKLGREILISDLLLCLDEDYGTVCSLSKVIQSSILLSKVS